MILAAVCVSWPPWEDPGLLPLSTGAKSELPANVASVSASLDSGPQLRVSTPAYKQGIFVVTGAGFQPGAEIDLYAQQPGEVVLPPELARRERLRLARVQVDADGRIYKPIDPRLLDWPVDIAPAYVIAYTTVGYVPSDTMLYIYANRVRPQPQMAPTLSPTPIPFKPGWEMVGFEGIQLSGQQRAPQMVGFPQCGQLNAGELGDKAIASAEWTTQLDVPLHAHYVFLLTVAGSARLSIDGEAVIDEWRLGNKERTQTVYLHLMHGLHRLKLEYSHKRNSHCKLELSWRLDYPDWCALFRNNTTFTGEVLAFRNLESTSRKDSDRPFKIQKDPNSWLFVDWIANAPAPEINPDNWSVDITRTISVTETGYYRFGLDVGERDEARAYLRHKPLYDHWVTSLTWSDPISLTVDRPYFVQVQFRDLGGPAALRFVWQKVAD